MIAIAVIGAGALGAAGTAYGASTAAGAQKSAAAAASAQQEAMYQQERSDLAPYMAQGASANAMLNQQLPSLIQPINMSEAALQKTPGYQFNLTQGLKAVQNSAAARGLGVSGAAQKGAATYATGLADSTYQNQFNNALTNKQFTYNTLAGQQQLGQASAAGVGAAGIQTGQSVGNNLIGAGNASAAAANTTGAAINSGLNSVTQGLLLNSLTGGGGGFFGGSGGGGGIGALDPSFSFGI
jgi:hypothetical protein